MNDRPVVILHAYSRANRGDGYLIDLTLEQLARVGVAPEDCVVVAGDAPSFADISRVRPFPSAAPPSSLRAAPAHARHTVGVGAASALGVRWTPPALRDVLGSARLIVGVGGGYLRAGSTAEAAKAFLVHVPQLVAAGSADVPTVYLPQSIGPLRGVVGHVMRSALRGIDTVCVRDDRTAREVGAAVHALRIPDLAVLRLAHDPPAPRAASASTVVLVARELPRDAGFGTRISRLIEALGDVQLAVQSRGRGNDDPSFYARAGLGNAHPSLPDALGAAPGAVVVAVRLHAALEALSAGHPVVHLSYERKGWGAFEDLGLAPYVHNAYGFDEAAVVRQVAELRADAKAYWQALEGQLPIVREKQQVLHETLRRSLA